MKPSNMTSQQYADNLVAKSCKVAVFYGDRTQSNVFIEGFYLSIRDSLRHYWAQKPQTDLNDIVIQEEYLPSIQKSTGKATNNN